MKTKLTALVILGFAILSNLTAQTPSYMEILDTNANAVATDAIALPASFFIQAESVPLGKLQRGIVLFAAAGRAAEFSNFDRALVLVQSAQTYLQAALPAFTSAQGEQRSKCLYYLGLIAEQYEGRLDTAQTYYNEAVNTGSGSTSAGPAKGRVKTVLAR